jgi:predicted MPP superfamily phosphohydrolase
LGLLVGEERLQRILARVIEARPDILLSSGDLVDGRLNQQDALKIHGKTAEMLAAVAAPSGKYAVTGNHEFYSGLNQALDFTQKAGFTILRDKTIPVGNYLSITGVDDPAGVSMGGETSGSVESALLRTADTGRIRILLKHRPTIDKASDGLFDLQLSGHSHKGQMFPFTLLVRLRYHLVGGTSRTAAGSMIHVSRGSGTWGPPLRFLAPPEVTIIDIVPAK